MALVKCKECGKEVSTKADACPNCGAKVKKPTGCGTLIVVTLVGVLVLVIAFGGSDKGTSPTTAAAPAPSPVPVKPPNTEEQAAAAAAKAAADAKRKKEEETFVKAQIGAKVLKQAMRDPDSFKLASVLVMDSGAVCYEYRARNGFGGMNVSHAVLSSDGKTFKGQDEDGFSRVWNKECSGKAGDDIVSTLQRLL